MFCPHCGKECDDNANFCPECGKRTDAENMQPVSDGQKFSQPDRDSFVQPTEASSEAALANEIFRNFRITKYVLLACLALIALTVAVPFLSAYLTKVTGVLEIGLLIWSFVFLGSVQGFFQQAGAQGFVSQCRSIRTSFILLIICNILISLLIAALVGFFIYQSIKSGMEPDIQAMSNGEFPDEMKGVISMAPMLSGVMLCFMTYPVVKFFYLMDVFKRISLGADVRQLVPADHSRLVLLMSVAIIVILTGVVAANLIFNRQL